MTNGDRGGGLASEILRSIALEYEWPDYKPQEKAVVPVSEETLKSYAGVYRFPNGPTATLMTTKGRLWLMILQRDPVELLPESETSFFTINGEIPPLHFTRKDDSVELTAGGSTAMRQ
jgi:hypothetical protein